MPMPGKFVARENGSFDLAARWTPMKGSNTGLYVHVLVTRGYLAGKVSEVDPSPIGKRLSKVDRHDWVCDARCGDPYAPLVAHWLGRFLLTAEPEPSGTNHGPDDEHSHKKPEGTLQVVTTNK